MIPMEQEQKGAHSRRTFVKNITRLGTGVATAALAGPALTASPGGSAVQPQNVLPPVAPKTGKPVIGIQSGVAIMAQKGVGAVLDDMKARGAVNALFLFSFTYIPKRAGIEMPGFHGGNFARVHPQYYKDIRMKPESLRSPDFGDTDFLASIIPEAKKRGIGVYPWVLEDSKRPTFMPGMEELYEIDLHGRRATGHPAGPCVNNPYYRNLVLGTLEDYVRSYEVDGIMWGSERQGPLGNALGAYHDGAKSDPGAVTCFCTFCREKGRRQGIDVEKVEKGFLLLEQYVRNGRAGKRPRDGYYVDFWRILLNHPEVLVWHTFWTNSMRELQQEIFKKVKSVKPQAQVGFHIWHNTSFNPIFRADQDYQLYTGFADYIKPVLYSNSAGERMSEYIASVSQNIYGDLSKPGLLEFEYKVMNLDEKPFGTYDKSGFSGDYVYREIKRTKEALAGSNTLLLAGVGIDEPSKHGSGTPGSVSSDIKGAIKGGADGMLISRYYEEMKPENLSAAGAALREMGWVQ